MLKQTAKKPTRSKAVKSVAKTPKKAEEDRYEMIAREAYLLAEQRNFQGDLAFDDWLQAEAKVDAQNATSH